MLLFDELTYDSNYETILFIIRILIMIKSAYIYLILSNKKSLS